MMTYEQAKLTVFDRLLPRIGDLLRDKQQNITVVVSGIHGKGMNGRMVMVRGLKNGDVYSLYEGAIDLSQYWDDLNNRRLIPLVWL